MLRSLFILAPLLLLSSCAFDVVDSSYVPSPLISYDNDGYYGDYGYYPYHSWNNNNGYRRYEHARHFEHHYSSRNSHHERH